MVTGQSRIRVVSTIMHVVFEVVWVGHGHEPSVVVVNLLHVRCAVGTVALYRPAGSESGIQENRTYMFGPVKCILPYCC